MSGTGTQQTMNPALAKDGAPPRAAVPDAASLARLGRGLQPLAVPGLVVLAWLGLGALNMLPAGIVPKLPAVLIDWYYWVFGRPGATAFDTYSGTWLNAVLYSGWRVVRGFALGVAAGVVLGVLIGWSATISRLLDPTIQLIRPIPITAWIPFAIAWFGIGDGNAIFLIALGAFFPVVLNTIHGARDINKNLVRAARMMGISEWRLLLKVILPNALPNIFTGMRLAMGIAWTILIVAEMISIRGGVGYVLWDAYYVSRMEIVVADMITVGLLGFLSDRIIVLVERQVLAWKHAHHS
ncbi:ABC transporter permease [Xanthobacter pseudotagetidis]|uniref:ABC transporter permease n=1 Tax=Xanthobacter pseudotagetidis TaxID=3119911 RepID=UPI00372AEE4E